MFQNLVFIIAILFIVNDATAFRTNDRSLVIRPSSGLLRAHQRINNVDQIEFNDRYISYNKISMQSTKSIDTDSLLKSTNKHRNIIHDIRHLSRPLIQTGKSNIQRIFSIIKKKVKSTVVTSLVALAMVVMMTTRVTASGHSSAAIDGTPQAITSTKLRNTGKQLRGPLGKLKGLVSEKYSQMKTSFGFAEQSNVGAAIDSITTGIVEVEHEAVEEIERSWKSLRESLSGIKHDGLFLLIVTSIIVPLFRHLKTSPIIGFLLTGTLIGPTGLNLVNDIHMIDVLGELGIVFFLFEMGLELSLERLQKMKQDVFGLGTSQFIVTAAFIASICMAGGLSVAASITIGGSLALSSSAFVLQLLKDKNAMGTRHGKASFGILLLQDLAVVPLIVIVELLSAGGTGLGKALTVAGIKAMVALTTMSYVGRKVLDPIFYAVAKSSSQEAFLSIILSTVLMMSFITKGIGLSDTLGAFLAGLLLAETKYHHQIEADIAPFRGILLGVFFITVGFSIDLNIILNEFPKIFALLFSLLAGKAAIITGLSSLFGISLTSAVQCGLLNAQGGEFAFVSLGIAERAGLIPSKLSKMLLTTVALSMACTPLMAELGSYVASQLEGRQGKGYVHLLGSSSQSETIKSEMQSNNFVFVCGYGRVGKMVCDMLDRKFIRYAAIDNSPQRAIEARNKGLPVFYGDVTRPDVLKGFDIGSAEAVVVAIDDVSITNRAVMTIRKSFPDLPMIVRAKNTQHQKKLAQEFMNVYAMSPVLPDDSVLLTLPFGGAVLQKIGVSKPEIDAILEDFRKMYIDDKEFDEESFDFLTSFRRRLPPSIAETKTEEAGSPAAEMILTTTDDMIAKKLSEEMLIQHAEVGVGYTTTDHSSLLNVGTNIPESPDFYLSNAQPVISSPIPTISIPHISSSVSKESVPLEEDNRFTEVEPQVTPSSSKQESLRDSILTDLVNQESSQGDMQLHNEGNIDDSEDSMNIDNSNAIASTSKNNDDLPVDAAINPNEEVFYTDEIQREEGVQYLQDVMNVSEPEPTIVFDTDFDGIGA